MRNLIIATLLLICTLPAQAAFRRARGKQPLKNRYIVLLSDTRPGEVDARARALAHEYSGHLLGTMHHAMQGFGIAMPEAQAIALSKRPDVLLVEEDELLEYADAPTPSFAPRTHRSTPPERFSLLSTTLCPPPPGASYFQCTYSNDTYWPLDRLDNSGPINNTLKAYAFTSTGNNVRAYVVDSGIYAAHEQFEGRVEAGANMLLDPDLANPVDPQGPHPYEETPITLDSSPATFPCNYWNPDYLVGHGTAVASVLGGRDTGVAKNVTLIPVKVSNCQNQQPKLAVARGLDWIQLDVAAHAQRAVVSMSQYVDLDNGKNQSGIYDEVQECEDGNGGYTNCVSAIEHEINELMARNVPVVVSANNQDNGNCRTSPARMGYGNEAGWPSTYRTITVGGTMYTGTNYADQRWTCAAQPGGCDATFGPTNPGSNYGACVSIWAPAWNYRLAHSSGPTGYRTGVGPASGTSFAAPYVAGAVARLLEQYPTLTATQVWAALASRADQRANMPDFDPSAVTNRRLVYISPLE